MIEMRDLAIRVEGVSKRSRLGQHDPYQTLSEALSRVAIWCLQVTPTRRC